MHECNDRSIIEECYFIEAAVWVVTFTLFCWNHWVMAVKTGTLKSISYQSKIQVIILRNLLQYLQQFKLFSGSRCFYNFAENFIFLYDTILWSPHFNWSRKHHFSTKKELRAKGRQIITLPLKTIITVIDWPWSITVIIVLGGSVLICLPCKLNTM